MSTYNVHGGHNRIVPGASALLDEVTEDRKVKEGVISRLSSLGHTVYDCTDDVGRTQGANLANIVAKCNRHTVDVDISIHLNSGRGDSWGDGKTGGVEVFIYDHELKDIAKAVADAIAKEFGYALRSDSTTPSGYAGVKISKSLYVLANTKAPAMLIECCFVDDMDDAGRWNSDKCAEAIVKGITGKEITSMAGKWIKDKVGWWWQNPDGSYPKSCWKLINGDYYYFGENGYALANQWLDYNGNWYWLNSDCRMAKGWKNLGGIYYYFNENFNVFPVGAMVYNLLITLKGKKYYLKDNGYMAKNETLKISGREYTFNGSGEVV